MWIFTLFYSLSVILRMLSKCLITKSETLYHYIQYPFVVFFQYPFESQISNDLLNGMVIEYTRFKRMATNIITNTVLLDDFKSFNDSKRFHTIWRYQQMEPL